MDLTLESRVRSAYGAEGDDFFRTNSIVGRINDSYSRTVSILASIEKNSNKTLRSLDNLRYRKNVVVDGTIRKENKYVVTSISKPEEVHDFLYLSFLDNSLNKTVSLDELSTKKLKMLEIGNAIPTKAEMYYHSYIVPDTIPKPMIDIYGYDIESEKDNVRIYYIKQPTRVDVDDTSLPELPPYLEQAVIMETCSRMALKDPDGRGSFEKFESKFQSQIKDNIV